MRPYTVEILAIVAITATFLALAARGAKAEEVPLTMATATGSMSHPEGRCFAFYGQSNSESWWCRDCPMAAGLVDGAWVLEPNGANVWLPLDDAWDTTPTPTPQTPFCDENECPHEVELLRSPFVWFAREFRLRYPDTEVSLISAGVGGTCLATQGFGAFGEPRLHPTTGDLYPKLLAAVDECPDPLEAVFFHQGECDGFGYVEAGMTEQQAIDVYYAALIEIADAVERDLGVPLILTPTRAFSPGGYNMRPIRFAQIVAVSAHPNILMGPQVEPLELTTWDGLHFIEAWLMGWSMVNYWEWVSVAEGMNP